MALNASMIAKKWVERTGGAAQAMKDGVNAVVTSPTELAAQAKDRWIAGVQKAAAEGSYEDGLRSVTLADWKQSMIDKGIPNMQNGVRAGATKVERFLRDFLPYVEQVRAEVQAMPKGTLQDSANRMLANMNKLAQFRKNRRG